MRFYKYIFVSLFFINPLNAFDEGYVYNDDIKIVYRDYGPKNAEPILLVQGLGSNNKSSDWILRCCVLC